MNNLNDANFESEVCKLKDSNLKVRGFACIGTFILVSLGGLGFERGFRQTGRLEKYKSTYGKIPSEVYVETLYECISESEYAEFYDLAFDFGLKLEKKTGIINTQSLRDYISEKALIENLTERKIYSDLDKLENKELTKKFAEYEIKRAALKYFDEELFEIIMYVLADISFHLRGINNVIEVPKDKIMELYGEEKKPFDVFKENLKNWILFNDMEKFVKILEIKGNLYLKVVMN